MYKLTNADVILRLTDNAFIPVNINNRDYKEYLVWIKEGNIPQEPDLQPIWDEINLQIIQILNETNWTVSVESKLQNKEEWLTYRQILRDIPQTFKTPDSVIWPTKPSIVEEY